MVLCMMPDYTEISEAILPPACPVSLRLAKKFSRKFVLMIQNVLVGEVWLAAGQSNMHLPLKSCAGGQTAVAAAGNTCLRLLNRRANAYPDRGAWSAPTPPTKRRSAAVALPDARTRALIETKSVFLFVIRLRL
jgi:hypothetical protein